jgi:hypothetical protein
MGYPKHRYTHMEVVGGGYGVTLIHTLTGTEFLRPGPSLAVVRPPGAPDFPGGLGYRLGLVSEGSIARMVEEPDDLVGSVSIASPELALRYARLFTSPAIAELLEVEWWFEVVPMSAVDDSFYFGREDRPWPPKPEARLKMLAEKTPADREREENQWQKWFPGAPTDRSSDTRRDYGVLYDQEWQQEGLPIPEVEPTEDGFAVRRVLFHTPYHQRRSEPTRTAWWVSESIGRDGLAHRQRLRELQVSERIALTVPGFGI